MKSRLLLLGGMILSFFTGVYSQLPVLKVDFEVDAGRKLSEVNEPGYTSWRVTQTPASKTLEGVTFTLHNGNVDDSWYKTGVQAPYYARLVNDGIKTKELELQITGLPIGKHNLVLFHNNFDNPENNTFSLLDIYVNRVLVVDDLNPTTRALSNDAASMVNIELDVLNNDPIVILFKSDPSPSSTIDEIPICGFHLNTPDPNKIARYQYPQNNDEHVDIDNDTLVFYWKPPENTQSQNLFVGANENDVFEARPSSPQFMGNIVDTFFVMNEFYSMDSYYWRIDPINSEGDTTKGEVWRFKKRIPAFPGAEGYGGYAIGGRGGKVVYVTNLEDDGPGSFRDAIENHSGPRTVLFAVSGLITLHDRLVINDDYITVAGQSAPGKGVCFRWAPIGVTGDDVIVQNLRLRLGIGITYDGMGLTGAERSIIDHCSISWTIDEAFSSRGAKNITLQRTLISEALNEAGHSNYGPGARHGYAASIGGDVGSFHHNLLAHCDGRNWSLAGGLDGDGYYAGRLDIFNNVVYNWGGRATDGGAHQVNFVNNYYKKGNATSQNTILRAQLEGRGKGSQSYFFSGNILENTDGSMACDGSDNTCSRNYELSNGQVLDWEVFVDNPFFGSQATIHTANEAYKHILSDVGCTQPTLDDHDRRIIDETLQGTYSAIGSKTGKPGLPDHENDVGAWEAYPGYERSPQWDSDLDGLPDWWEKYYGLNVYSQFGDFSDSNADEDKNGYTNLEEYLHWMGGPHFFVGLNQTKEIKLNDYAKGFTNQPTFSVFDVENGLAELFAGDSIVRFTAESEGMAQFNFSVNDAEGSSMTRTINLYVGEIPKDSVFHYAYYEDRSLTKLRNVPDSMGNEGPVSIPGVHQKNNQVVVYPNPAQEFLTIEIVGQSHAQTDISIADITGKIESQLSVHLKNGLNVTNIDVSSLKPGMYSLRAKNNTFVKTVCFIKL